MGDATHDSLSLNDALYRERTYSSHQSIGPHKMRTQDLAKAGFFHTMRGEEIKCYHCGVIIDCAVQSQPEQVISFHRRQNKNCPFAMKQFNIGIASPGSTAGHLKANNIEASSTGTLLQSGTGSTSALGAVGGASSSDVSTVYNSDARCPGPASPSPRKCHQKHPAQCKVFHTFDSLRYERERLATFIDWPLSWLSPESLAKEGFYYLRESDHCSCVFCRGVVGSWEVGDVPRTEHKRHFETCNFVRGQPVGNVPIGLGDLLSSLPMEPFFTLSKPGACLLCK